MGEGDERKRRVVSARAGRCFWSDHDDGRHPSSTHQSGGMSRLGDRANGLLPRTGAASSALPSRPPDPDR